jgi:hypothetical protein
VLIARGVKATVVACNTVSSVALDMMRVELDLPVLGVILAGARAAVAASRGEPIGVPGTTGTIASGAYPRAVASLSTPTRGRSRRSRRAPRRALVVMRDILVLCAALAPLACVAAPELPPSPALAGAPAGSWTDENARRAAAVATAERDLACGEVAIVAALDRRYLNGTVARYVIEGCGKRGLYVETCEEHPGCQYLLVSVVPAVGGR